MDDTLNKLIDGRASKVARKILNSSGFTERKVTDTPTDSLAVVNRKYVNANGTVRPTSSIVGQFFLDTTLASGLGKPIWWNGTGWIDATGTYV